MRDEVREGVACICGQQVLVRVRAKIHKYIIYGPPQNAVYARGEGGALQINAPRQRASLL